MADINTSIEIKADGSQAVAEMRKVGTAAGTMGTEVAAGANKAGSSLSNMADEFNSGAGKSIGAFTGLIGKITAVVGVATAAFQAGQKLQQIYNGPEAGDFLNTLTSNKPVENIKKIQEELDRVNGNLAASKAAGLSEGLNILGGNGTIAQMERQAAELNKRLQDQLGQQRAIELREKEKTNAELLAKNQEKLDKELAQEQEAAIKRRESLAASLNEAYVKAGDEREQIERRAAADIAEYAKKFNAETDADNRKMIQDLIEYRKRQTSREIKEYEDKKKESEARISADTLKMYMEQVEKERQEQRQQFGELKSYQKDIIAGFNGLQGSLFPEEALNALREIAAFSRSNSRKII